MKFGGWSTKWQAQLTLVYNFFTVINEISLTLLLPLYQVEQAGTKVEGYLDDQHKLSGQASEEEMTFLKDLADQNKKLSAQMTAEQEAAAEYRKVSLV